jgi:hypothetical protein
MEYESAKASVETHKNIKHFVKNIIFWGVTPCYLLEIYYSFAVTYCLRLQDRSVSQVEVFTARIMLYNYMSFG